MKLLSAVGVFFLVGPITPPNPPIVIDLDYKYKNKFDFIYADPLKNDGTTSRMKIKVSFEDTLHISAYVRIKIRNDNYPDGVLLEEFIIKGVKNYTCNYEYDQRYTNVFDRRDVYLFELFSEYGDDRVEIITDYQKFETWVAKDTDNSFSSSRNVHFYNGDTVIYVPEEIKINNCVQEMHLLDQPYYEINHFDFYYSVYDNATQFRCDNPRLVITTHDGYFSDLGELSPAGFRVINLKFQRTADTLYRFYPINDMYVNPNTLEMSSSKKKGYVKTDRIYFPITCDAEEKFEFRFVFDYLGANGIQFFYISNVYAPRRIFGNCFDSAVCVSTEESTPAIDLGTRIER